MTIPINQLAESLKEHIQKTTQKVIEKNIVIGNIPAEDLDVLCRYLSVSFVSEMFGGNYQVNLKRYNTRIKTREAEERQRELLEEEGSFEPIEPSGIEGWQYADRLRNKVFRQLEAILNQGITVAGHNQVVQAAKALLAETDKSKKDASDVMMAYQTQLLLFAEHLVELFLPSLGSMFRADLNDVQETVLKKVKFVLKDQVDSIVLVNIWKKEISRMARNFSQKRFELMLAETMIGNKELSEALDFSKDLIEAYRQTDIIDRDSKSAAMLKQHIQKRG